MQLVFDLDLTLTDPFVGAASDLPAAVSAWAQNHRHLESD